MNKKIKKAVFPVAGLGTRFLPATKTVPKEMLTVLDRPIIEWSVIEAFKSGIEQIIFVTSSKKNMLSEHFDKSRLLEDLLRKKKKNKELEAIRYQTSLGEIVSVMQTEPKGLGHAVWCARNLIQDEKFCVILPDDIISSKKPVLKQILDLEKKVGGSVLAVEKIDKKESQKYGILKIDELYQSYFKVKDIVEKPLPSKAPSDLSVIGRYVLEPKIFKFLNKQKIGVGGEVQLTDGIQYLMKESSVYGFEFEGDRYDCGSKLGFVKANLGFAINDVEIKKEIKNFIKKI
ncbi:UTP--glucose-1-phosphate uridylyltransferase GalU [Rickettsiales bacterium]|nr:UTP--glucose-1-phosphate uridylyltransferase GalU [Rickettsiales bacterium]